jgi:ferritin-like metal-binding protein YciE
MPQMTEPRELFIHELEDVMFAEKTLAKALPKLEAEATDEDLAKGFGRHAEQTLGHITNLEDVFEAIGEKAKAVRCPGIEGLQAEHDEFVADEDPSPEVLDLFLTGAAARTEHYEIAAYTGLVLMAKALGETDAAELLQENLAEEKAMLIEVEKTAKRLGDGVKQSATA